MIKEYATPLIVEHDLVFQQDNAPIHKSKLAMVYFESVDMQLHEHPPQSPDLNPIEMLWAIIKYRIDPDAYHTRAEFIQGLTDIWDGIEQD